MKSRLAFAWLVLALAACGRDNVDRLDPDELAGAPTGNAASAAPRCTARVTVDAVKRELFRRAAEVRGSNADDFARIAEFSVLMLDSGAAGAADPAGDCAANATLRLPPGLRVAGGRSTLAGDIAFGLSSGSASVTLVDVDVIVIPLSTLTQRRAAAAPAPRPQTADPLAPAPEAPVVEPTPAEPPLAPPVASVSIARPSFDCRRARTRGERAVCASPLLANLDRTMAAQYEDAQRALPPAGGQLLRRTRDRFLAYRDGCASDACIASAYRGRMREIDDIVAGRWTAPR